MTRDRWRSLLAALLVASAWPIAAPAITIGQVDTFQDGTTQGWVDALQGAISPVPPTVLANSGPNGAGDFALRLSSTGSASGAGSKLVVNNVQPRWLGDYRAAFVTGLVLDLRNLGTTDLDLRVAVDGPAFGTTGGRWVSDDVFVPAQSGWQTLTFSLLAGDLLAGDFAATDAATTLANVAVLRVLHAPTASYTGAPIASQVLVDNIEVLPEPSLALSLLAGCALARAVGAGRQR